MRPQGRAPVGSGNAHSPPTPAPFVARPSRQAYDLGMDLFRHYWAELRANLWFLPAVSMAGAVALALLLVEVDSRIDSNRWLRWSSMRVGADGARGVLTAIATSMITIAGVAFSITIVALSLTASQYSSRVLRNFMSDRTNRLVLGILVGTFAYCLAVLRTIRGGDEGAFVPSLAVFAGVLLAFIGIGAFVYFIHHIATAIQASQIVASVARETLEAIDHLFPDELAADDREQEARGEELDLFGPWHVVDAAASGYLQHLRHDALLEFARRRQVVVRMQRCIGDFVIEGSPLASISGSDPPDDGATQELNSIFIINHYRTMTQDASFGIRQLVDVALKALSPGVNDSTTAITCVDWLGAVLMRLVHRQIPSRERREDGQLRVVACGPTFESMVADSFNQIRQASAGNGALLQRQLHVLAELLANTKSLSRKEVLASHAERIIATARSSIAAGPDRDAIEAAMARCSRLIRTPDVERSESVARK